MKATFPLKKLLEAVSAVASVVPSRTPKDVLKNVKLVVEKDICSLSATDSEISIIRYIRDAECQTPGEILLPCAKLMQILRESIGDSITIEAKNDIANIAVGRAKFKIPTEDPATFPPVTEFKDADFFSLSASDLRKMIRRTCPCCDVKSTRYALGGVLFEMDGNKLYCVATDTRRLGVVEAEVKQQGKPSPPAKTIVPEKAMKVIESVIDVGDVDLSFGANSITVRSGDSTVQSQFVAGLFPGWRRVIPTDFDFSVSLPATQIIAALRQAMITRSEESVAVDFHFTSGLLSLNSKGANVGESVVEMPVAFEGDVTISLDPTFTIDAAKMVDQAASLTMQFSQEGPVLFTCDDGLKYVQMPLSRDR